jgi:hypothetical protein
MQASLYRALRFDDRFVRIAVDVDVRPNVPASDASFPV